MQVSMIIERSACEKTQKKDKKDTSGNIQSVMFHLSVKKSRSNIAIINKFDPLQNGYQFNKE